MSKYASEVVRQAQAWIGKKESDGSHKEIIDVYNSHKPLARGYAVKYTDAWCSTFVSAVAIKLGYTDIIPTECGCEKHIQLFKNIGSWIENENRTPKAGDIIFYDWEDNGSGDNRGHSDHIGIVEKVSNSTITVIEGNINNAVGRRTLKVNGKYIRGYATPKYNEENQQNITETKGDEFNMAKIYKNGSTIENVYADTGLTVKIGSLNTYEQCECLDIVNGRYLVKYKVDGTNNYKCGFVKYSGGISL
ncbi:MAG: CHAP domain-containing protein [Clostridia bacterium]